MFRVCHNFCRNNSRVSTLSVRWRQEQALSQNMALPGTPAFYRTKAAELLRQAEVAADQAAREQFLKLAEQWHHLAMNAENPSW